MKKFEPTDFLLSGVRDSLEKKGFIYDLYKNGYGFSAKLVLPEYFSSYFYSPVTFISRQTERDLALELNKIDTILTLFILKAKLGAVIGIQSFVDLLIYVNYEYQKQEYLV